MMAGPGAGVRGFATFSRMSLRALFLLNLWNDKTLQGPGFAWALGAFPRLRGAKTSAKHLGTFNTTPAMAPCIIGAVARMEIEGGAPAQVAKVKDYGAACAAAVGDRLFWGSIRPSAALAGLLAATAGPLAALVSLVAVQGLPQAYFRLSGAFKGLALGSRAVRECIEQAGRALRVSRLVGSALAGAFAGSVLGGLRGDFGTEGVWVFLAAVPVMGWLISWVGVRPSWLCVALLLSAGTLSLVR